MEMQSSSGLLGFSRRVPSISLALFALTLSCVEPNVSLWANDDPLATDEVTVTPAAPAGPADSSIIVPDPVPTPAEPVPADASALPAPTPVQEIFDSCCVPADIGACDAGSPWLTRPNLFGTAFGLRPALGEQGIAVDGNLTQFYQGVASGGKEQGFRYGGHADYYMNVDGQKAGLWAGLFLTLHAETIFGQSANGLTGALLPVSLIQILPSPTEDVTALTGVKVTQALSENFVTYFGKINTLDEFKQPFASGRGVDAFMNTSLLFSPVLARTVPYSSFGAGAAYLHNGQPVAVLSVFDTNNSPTTSGFDTFFDNGATIVGQAILPTNLWDRPGHQSLGFSYSSGHYVSLDRSSYLNQIGGGNFNQVRQTGSEALFYQFDQTVWTSAHDPAKSWGVFGNAGLADRNPNPIRWSANIGIGGSSPFCGRPLDTFGAAYFYVGINDSLKNLAPLLLPLRDEQGVEFFYNYAATPWLRITPDLQVLSPARQNFDTEVILGLRAKIVF